MDLDSPAQPPQQQAVSPRRQAVVALVLLAAIAGLSFLLLQVRSNSGHLQALAGAACRGDVAAASQLRSYLHVVLGLVPLSTLAFAGYVGVLARRAYVGGVFPPPGMLVLGRARTFTGVSARRIAAVMFGFSATLALLAVLLTALGLRMLALLDR